MLGFESDLWKACARKSFCTIGTSQENGHFIGTTVKADKTNFPVVCSVSGVSVVVFAHLPVGIFPDNLMNSHELIMCWLHS